MTVLVLDNASDGIRGQVTRWMLELKPGIFVGTISAKVRELLWADIKKSLPDNGALLLYSANNEQGFEIQMWNTPNRSVVDFDGLYLIKREVEK